MNAHPTPSSSGFTLIEMLVALSILSVAALALVRLDAFALRSAADLNATALARIVASNAAVDRLSDPVPAAPGTSTATVTNGGRTFSVTQRATATPDPGLLRIDITATDTDGGPGNARATLVIVTPAG